jgi:hypothetical protein
MRNKSEIEFKLVIISWHENYILVSTNTKNLEGFSVK